MATNEPKIVPVLAMYAAEARAKLEKLARRAAKYGQVISWTETPRTEVQLVTRPDGKKIKREIERVDFAVEGEAPRVGDFKFLAALEKTEGGVLVSAVKHDGPDIGKLGYKWDGRCEHCRSNRVRYYGYVVENEKGKRKVVGKTCLRDYVGTDVPAAALWIFESVRDFGGGSDEEGGWGGGYSYAELIEGVVAVTRAAIAIWGWRPSSHEGITTSSYVTMYTSPRRDTDSRGRDIWADERRLLDEELKARGDFYEAEALKVVEWGRNLKPRSDYEHNLKVAMSGQYVTGKTFNLVVSACAAYDRQVEREDEAKAKRLAEEAERAAINALPPSRWIGHEGAKIEVEVIVDRVLAMPDNGFGPSQLYKFKAIDGPLLCWFTGSYPKVGGAPVRANERFKLRATVKDHKTYNGIEETQITRAKLERIAA